jgi:hypothetical protein
MPGVPRPALLAMIALAIVGFAAISLVLAHGFGAASSERSAVVDLIRAEARGDTGAVVDGLAGCRTRPGCPERVTAIVDRLRRPGRFQVIRVDTSTQFALGDGDGATRIVWRAGDIPPVVQCVAVRRRGSVLGGLHVDPVRLSPALHRAAPC